MRKFACNKFSFLLQQAWVGLLLLPITFDMVHPLHAVQFATADSSFTPSQRTLVSASWKGQSLGLVLDRLATYQEMSYWIDRRVDTQQPVDLQVRNMPLGNVLDALTKDRSLGWSDLGSVCYVGPQAAAQETATLLKLANDSVERLPPAKRKVWTQKEAVSWARLSEPRLLLAGWLHENGISLKNPELITHDLWPARRFPPLSLIERVVLLLNGFDLTCQISSNGNTCTLVPIKRPVRITRTYEVDRYSQDVLTHLEREAPDLKVSRQGRELTATGRWEDQLKLRRLLSGRKLPTQDQKPEQSNSIRQRFSLRLENQPLGSVISQIAHQVGMDLEWDERLLISKAGVRDQLVSCDVQEVDLTSLLRSILDPEGVDFRVEDDTLILFAPTE